jgi:hypothetical protein
MLRLPDRLNDEVIITNLYLIFSLSAIKELVLPVLLFETGCKDMDFFHSQNFFEKRFG